MSAVDFGFWVVFGLGFVTGLCYGRREALVERLLALLEGEPAPRVLPRSHPSIRVLRGPYDWTRDEERDALDDEELRPQFFTPTQADREMVAAATSYPCRCPKCERNA